MTSQPFRLPTPQSLPDAQVSLAEAVQFIRTIDAAVIEHFRQRWRDDYPALARAQWERCVQEFRAGEPAAGPPEELLLVLAYDCAVGPYLGVPEPHTLTFWRWLLDGIRRGSTGAEDVSA